MAEVTQSGRIEKQRGNLNQPLNKGRRRARRWPSNNKCGSKEDESDASHRASHGLAVVSRLSERIRGKENVLAREHLN